MQNRRARRVVPALGVLLAALALTAVRAQVPVPGGQLPPWTPGTLEIHHIATGEGNATFFVLPDGTTMLVDAGAATAGRAPLAPPVPNDGRRAGEHIAAYIERMMPAGRDPAIDYAVITHFHGDHMGFASDASPLSARGNYRLAGITDVADAVPVHRLIDRGWPDYDYPAPVPDIENYRRFIAVRTQAGDLTVSRFQPGRSDQLRLLYHAATYPSFKIRNLAANGEVWTGSGTATRKVFPPLETLVKDDWPNENICSIAFLLRYGAFSYFTGGDQQGVPPDGYPAWQDVETPIARAIGHPVDVVEVDHHGSIEPANAFFLKTLRPRVDVIPAWSTTHPAPVVLKRLLNKRIYPGPRDIFVLEFRDETKAAIGPRAAQVKSDHGHVVVRVAPGGASYMVYVLDDRSDTYGVLSVHGPYASGAQASAPGRTTSW
jgi:beta-lactamase superfamily II metal-dependent hydrolase